jgi:hypothetical protein
MRRGPVSRSFKDSHHFNASCHLNMHETFRCLESKHFVCRGCLQGLVLLNHEPRRLAKNNGGIPCPGDACTASCWAIEEHLEPHLEKATTLKLYASTLRHFDGAREREAQKAELAVKEAEAKSEEIPLEEKAQKLRMLIVDKHLYQRCPRCATRFDDYDGCNALECGSCGCGFCAVCMADCGEDAHEHIKDIHGGDLFDKPLFQRESKKRFLRRLCEAVKELAGEGEALQRMVVAELDKVDLGGLGISAEDVLCGARVGKVVTNIASKFQLRLPDVTWCVRGGCGCPGVGG